MDSTMWSRLLTAETLIFHIIWATIGVGVPIFIMIAEGWGIFKKDPHYILMAKRWTRGFVITVAVGIEIGPLAAEIVSVAAAQPAVGKRAAARAQLAAACSAPPPERADLIAAC